MFHIVSDLVVVQIFMTFLIWLSVSFPLHATSISGLPEDKVSAVELYKKAAAAGNPSAQDSLDRLQAEAAIAQWKGENYCVSRQ